MPRVAHRPVAAVALILAGLLSVGLSGDRPWRGRSPLVMPAMMLWVWDHPQDLNFIDPQKVGVAFLAERIFLRGDRVEMIPRGHPIFMPPGTVRVAVVRIEAASDAVLSLEQRREVADAVLSVQRHARLSGIQVDFEAVASHRPFYRALLNDLRRRWPTDLAFSITALASWCQEKKWLDDLPADEVVPMFYRMGEDAGRELRRHFANGGEFRQPICRNPMGLSIDEPRPPHRPGRRLYWFNPKPWTPSVWRQIVAEVSP
ncbi:MAG: DUF3142 domain-containing protein [Magnetococcales bacterium]|nr:DUF3142 domain-containing protein [Magnetococcales bacterium]